jgi:hypothetical protein
MSAGTRDGTGTDVDRFGRERRTVTARSPCARAAATPDLAIQSEAPTEPSTLV